MPRSSPKKYQPLPDIDEEDAFSDAETLKSQSHSNGYKDLVLAISATVITAINVSLWLLSVSRSSGSALSFGPEIWSPMSSTPHLLAHSLKHISGEIKQQNAYRGFPTPELDQAWERIGLAAPGVAIPGSDVMRLNKTTENLHLLPHRADAKEEEYLGILEVFHLLHCLDSVRSTAYRDLYREEVAFMPIQHMDAYRIHLDHCVDMLRENLMCTSDASVVLFQYDDHHTLPQPKFSMNKKCRNFEAILQWNHETEKRVEWDTLEFGQEQRQGHSHRVDRPSTKSRWMARRTNDFAN